MANTDPKESGIHAWMTSVRASMADDPCRQLFEDQLETHAFIFLDDYLEHILSGPKQVPIIELVKTPGRKKNIPRKARATATATAKVKNAPSFSLDDDGPTKDVPINSFHNALLQAKARSAQDASDLQRRSNSVQVANIPDFAVSGELEPQASVIPLLHHRRDPPGEPSTTFAASERSAVLSVIVEGDESPERSRANVLPLSTIGFDQRRLPEITQPLHGMENSVPPSVDAYNSMPLDSHGVQSFEACISNHTEPLPPRTTINTLGDRERNVSTAPLPVFPASNPIPISHAISVPLSDSSPRTLDQKSGGEGFPMFPAPSPLRKSMRVTQDSLTSSALPVTVPPPMPLGKRTSWLMKAREAKAMEGTSSVSSTSLVATSVALPRASTAVKRKSGEMLGVLPPAPDREEEQRKPKFANGIVAMTSKGAEKNTQCDSPSVQGEPVAPSFTVAAMPVDYQKAHEMSVGEQVTHLNPTEDGFIDLFKRTVEGLGTRVGKSTGKSLGGAVVVALAEARAAAEAKVAERNKIDVEWNESEVLRDHGLANQESFKDQTQPDDQSPTVPILQGTKHRLSLSDLVPDTVQLNKPKLSLQVKDANTRINSDDESFTMTPPNSPPLKGCSGFVKPVGPVFNKPPPPPVFMPPASKQLSTTSGHSKEFTSNFPSGHFTVPVAVSLGIPARLTSPSDGFLPLVQGTSQVSGQSSQSNILFDPVTDKLDVRACVPSTQDTPYTTDLQPYGVESVIPAVADDDDDDSWPLEEKLAAVESGWRPFDFSNIDKEDTWSSLPTESQGPTRNLTTEMNGDAILLPDDTDIEGKTKNEKVELEQEAVSDVEHSILEASELGSAADAGVAGSGDIEPITRGASQTSMVSTSSSQSQAGFFSQATKLVNNMLGGGKKAKPELKSLQLAAAAAKKQQEEADKKMQRLKDMEARRQVATAKKATEERTRLLEEEKKSKEIEKRKREREENTDRRPPKPPVSTKKVEDDAFKKRKLAPETEKKSESKKPPSKDTKDHAPSTKLAATPAAKLATQKGAKAGTAALVSSAAYNATQNAPPDSLARPTIPEAKPFKVVPSSLKGKTTAKTQQDDIGDKLPSTVVQSQMAARAKAQMRAAKLSTPEVPSESIELPDINSEYSDSGDEERVRTFNPPDWAQSPELRQALQMQSTVNPDEIFGAIRPLRMEEMFRTRQSRFRARTSSANWSGSDRLTAEEIRDYEQRMGFQQAHGS